MFGRWGLIEIVFFSIQLFAPLVFNRKNLSVIVLCTNNTNLRKLTMIELLVRIPVPDELKNLNTFAKRKRENELKRKTHFLFFFFFS